MPTRTRALPLLFCVALAAGCAATDRRAPAPGAAAAPEARLQPSLRAFRQRLPVARQQIPGIARAADAAAERILAHPLALISTPTAIQQGFADELSNRAGGLSNIGYPELRPKEVTNDDVILFAVRSWEKDGPQVAKLLREYKDKGQLTVVFASARGAPPDLAADFLIDNGAPGPEAVHGPVNAIANTLTGWMWCCEYVAALTRHGRCPGVLISASYAKYEIYDAPLQASPGGRQWLGECRKPVPAGELAGLYLDRVTKLADDMAGPRTQEQVAYAADLAARRVAAGKALYVSGIGHLILTEMTLDLKAPWKPVQSIGDAKNILKKNVQPDGLLLWIGYLGLDSRYEDFASAIRGCQADLIACCALDADPSLNGPWALARLDQSWSLGDSEVPIPCPPGRMAPLSGIDATLLFRMLDEETASRLPSH